MNAHANQKQADEGFVGGSPMQSLPASVGVRLQSLGQGDALAEGMAAHPSILARRFAWTGEPGRLQSKGSRRGEHNLELHRYLNMEKDI